MAGALFLLFQGIGALSFLGLAMVALRRWPIIGLYAIGAFILMAWEMPNPINLVSAFGVQIKAEDVLFVLLALETLLRPQRLMANTRKQRTLMISIALCLVAAFVVSVATFGSTAINEIRVFLWGIAIVAWLLNHDWADEKLGQQFHNWVAFTGWALTAIFAYHASRYGLGGADSFVVVDSSSGIEQTGRPLVAGQAFALACCGLFMFRKGLPKPEFRVLGGLVFLMVAILCQHRSVWVAIAVAAVIGLSQLRGRARAHAVFWGGYSLLILLIFVLVGALDPLIAGLEHSVSSTGTYNERSNTWELLVAQAISQGPPTVMFGSPFGSGYDRVVNGRFVTYSPHNWYVIIFLRLGLFGLIAYVAALLSICKNLMVRKEWTALSAFTGLMVYCWAYALPWYVALIFGWCAFLAWRAVPKRDTAAQKVQYPSPAYARLKKQPARTL